ncbi:unnamed protein product [Rhodiola kirilowii]
MAGLLAATLLVLASTVILATSAPPACQTVLEDLTPCIAFLTADDRSPSSGCCSGVRAMTPYSIRQGDRSAVCECLKIYASSLGRVDMSQVAQIPKMCGVDVKLPNITPDIDCSKYQFSQTMILHL